MNGKRILLAVLVMGWFAGSTLMAQTDTTSKPAPKPTKIDGVDYLCAVRATSGIYNIMIDIEKGLVWTATSKNAAGEGFAWQASVVAEIPGNNGDGAKGADRCNAGRQGSTCFQGQKAASSAKWVVNGILAGEKGSRSVQLEIDQQTLAGILKGYDLPDDHLGVGPLDRDDVSNYRASQRPRWITYYENIDCWKNGTTPKANSNFHQTRDGLAPLFAMIEPSAAGSEIGESNNGGRQNNVANVPDTTNTTTINPTSNNGAPATNQAAIGHEVVVSKGAKGQSDGGSDEKTVWKSGSKSNGYDERKTGLGGSGQCHCNEGGCPVCTNREAKERRLEEKSGGRPIDK